MRLLVLSALSAAAALGGDERPASPGPPAPASKPPVIFSEIHYHPPRDADAQEEFIELHNRTGAEVDLHGWEVRDGIRFRFDRAAGPARIPARGYLVVARDPAALSRLTGLPAERIAGPFAGKLSNFRDRLALFSPEGKEVEAVEYSQDGDWPARADGLGSSLQRISSEEPAGLARNWTVLSGRGEQAAGERVLIEDGARVRWHENLDGSDPGFSGAVPWWHPEFDDASNGWRDGRLAVGYDLINRRGQGWIRTDATPVPGLHSILIRIRFDVPEGVSAAEVPVLSVDWDDGFIAWLNGVEIARRGMRLPPGSAPPHGEGYLAQVIPAGGDDGEAPGYRRVWSGPPVSPHPAGGGGRLRPGRNLLAIGSYNSGPRSSDLFSTVRLALASRGGNADLTPGGPSPAAAASAPPLVTFLDRVPGEPTSRQPVVLRARVEGGDLARVDLFHDSGSGEKTIAMRADGPPPGDPAAGRVYSAVVPPAPDLTVVRFRIEAHDSRGGLGRFPREGNPSPHAGYYVVDRPPRGNDDLEVYHMLWTGELRCARGAWLRGCTFIHRGTAYLDVGFKYRGETSCGRPKSGMRVGFNRGDLFRGQRKLNLLACWEDRAVLREKLAWELYRDVGHPHCRAEMALVHGKGNLFHGLYIALEDPGQGYLRRNGLDPDGTLWKCRTGLNGLTARFGGYLCLSGAEDPERQAELGEFGRLVNSLRGEELVRFLLENVDVDSFIDYHAVKCVTGDEDGYVKNWLLYCQKGRWKGTDPAGRPSSRWSVHPWDLDLSFGQINLMDDAIYARKHPLMGTRDHPRLTSGNWNGITEAFFGRSAGDHFLKALYGRIHQLLEEKFNPEALGEKIERIHAATAREARADLERWPRWGMEPRDVDFHRERLKAFVEERARFLRSFITSENFPRRGAPPFRYTPAPRMKITEVHYNPEEGDALEFIEVRNLEKDPVDLSGWSVPAVGYVFPAGSKAPAGSHIIIARDPVRLGEAHPRLARAAVFGPYPGRLSNGGEVLRLKDAGLHRGKRLHPETIDAVPYRDSAPWPAGADGRGKSIELEDLRLDNDLPASWRASRAKGGSPGA